MFNILDQSTHVCPAWPVIRHVLISCLTSDMCIPLVPYNFFGYVFCWSYTSYHA